MNQAKMSYCVSVTSEDGGAVHGAWCIDFPQS